MITAQKKQGKFLIDSLLQELAKQRSDTEKINLLNEISFAYGFIDPKEGIRQGQHAQRMAEKNKWNKGLGFAYFNIGYNHGFSSNSDSAMIYFKLASAVNTLLSSNSLKTKLYYGYGLVHQNNFENTMALDFYQKALNQISYQHPDKTFEGLLLLNIGLVWNGLSNSLKALEFFHKGVKLAEQLNDYYLLASAYSDIGTVYFYFDPKQAIENYNRALEYNILLNNKVNMAVTLCNINLVEANLSEYNKALGHNQAALKNI